jgi:hypothetical protein
MPRILPSGTDMLLPPSSTQVEDSSISEHGPTVEATFTSCAFGERYNITRKIITQTKIVVISV